MFEKKEKVKARGKARLCAARKANGTKCMRKARPDKSVCSSHLDSEGKVRSDVNHVPEVSISTFEPDTPVRRSTRKTHKCLGCSSYGIDLNESGYCSSCS